MKQGGNLHWTLGGSYVGFSSRQKVTIGLNVEGEEQLAVLNAALAKEEGTTKSVQEGFKDAFKDIGSSIDLVSKAFDSVIGGIKKMGVSMDSETERYIRRYRRNA